MARWTEEEERLLRELYTSTDNKTLSNRLGRSLTSVECKASRMGLKKETTKEAAKGEPPPSSNPLVMISREQTLELDKIELLRLIWSLALMYRRELANPGLTKAERHKLMNALSNHTSIINNILKGAEDELKEGEEDLEAAFIEITRETPARVKARRVIVDMRRKRVVLR